MKTLNSLILLLLIATQLHAESITIQGFGKQTPIRKWVENKIDYMSAADLFNSLGGKVEWKDKNDKLEVSLGKHDLVFQMSNMFCSVDDRLYNLVYPPIFHVDDLYVPVNQTLYLLSDVLERVLIYDNDRNSIAAVKEGFNVAGVSLQEKVNGDLLEVMLTKKLDYEIFVSEGNWINVTIHGGRVDADRLSRKNPNEKIIGIRAFQFENSAQVSIQMRTNVVKFHDNYVPDPHRIQISLENRDYAQQPLDTTTLIHHDTYNPIDVVVIDPGHGGEHDGAIGKNGTKEKDIVLDIALKLESIMQQSKRFTPVLTRHDDSTVGLEDRAKLANEARGDLFVSIHANSSEEKNASGVQTFFLAAAKSNDARITEMLENKDFQIEVPGGEERNKKELDFIVMDLLQTEYLSQSQEFAETVQSELATGLNIKSRGIEQAGFVVLNKVQMPSILVETAFISNKVEEKLLSQDDFRERIALAVYNGIVKFADKYDAEKKTNAKSE